MRVLITGVSGFLGRQLARRLQGQHALLGTYREHAVALDGCATAALDIADADGVRALCRDFRPEVIVHTAVRGDVEHCQRHPEEAHRINVEGTAHVAQAAAAVGARLIYLSTDQVYDGEKGPYDERDAPRPLMVYGRTKLEGEQRALALCADTVVLRLALMYGWGNPSRPTFTDWMLARLCAGQEVPLFVDQYRSPLYVGQAAEAIARLIDRPAVRGVFNLGGGERLDRYSFGLKLCAVFELPTQLLRPVAMATVSPTTPRPRDCSMTSAAIGALLGLRLLSVEEGLRAMRPQRRA
jgi:dTDP-4-dehydrorhamnose reductase